jgi:hypothetical protein
MEAHKIEAVLTEDGTLMLRGLPFHAGDAVEVIILSAKSLQQQTPTNLYPLRDTQPYRYDEPTEPVALEDWEVLQ